MGGLAVQSVIGVKRPKPGPIQRLADQSANVVKRLNPGASGILAFSIRGFLAGLAGHKGNV